MHSPRLLPIVRLALLLALLGPLGAFAPHANAGADQPDILLVIADDMAPADLGAYGGTLPTPHLDRLAEGGMRMDRAYCTSAMCTPSRYSIMTGRLPGRCEHEYFLQSNPMERPYRIAWNTLVGPGVRTIAHDMHDAGYHTAFSGKWHLAGKAPPGYDIPHIPEDADLHDPATDALLQRYQAILQKAMLELVGFDDSAGVLWGNWDGAEGFPIKELRWHQMPWFTHEALSLIDDRPDDKPMFLCVCVTAVHGPDFRRSTELDPTVSASGRIPTLPDALPGPEDIKRRLNAAGEVFHHRPIAITQLDDMIGRLTQRFARSGRETIVVFTADHGDEPGKCSPYDKGAQVPFLVSWPGRITPGSSSDATVSLVDLIPTLLDAANADPPRRAIDGVSQTPVWIGRAPRARSVAYIENGYTRAVSDGRFKYIAFRPPADAIERMRRGQQADPADHFDFYHATQTRIARSCFPGYFEPDQLYDLAADPHEQHNLALDPAHAADLARLQRELRAITATLEHPFPDDPDPFLLSDAYRAMAEQALASPTTGVGWWDAHPHAWPPK